MASLADRLEHRFRLPANSGTSKVTTLAEALRTHVTPGSTVHVAYSDARPNAALFELARVFAGTKPRLTLVTAGLVNAQHALLELGVVDRVIASFAGENYPLARPNPAMVRAVREGRVRIENWSLWSLIARLAAGALGVSHFPVRSLAGSSMAIEAAARGEYMELAGDDSAEPTSLVSALRPDVVVMQAVAADPQGNVIMSAPYGESHWGALAARRGVIACVERIVDTATIRQLNTLVRVPAHAVLAVCEVPFGSHPYGLYNPGVPDVHSYVEDEEFVADALAAAGDPDGFLDWIESWILGVRDHSGYLDRLGSARLARLADSAGEDVWRAELSPHWSSGAPATDLETQVVLTARQLARRVRAGDHQAVLAGVGLANLSAWVGVENLRDTGVDVQLMSEIGMFGYTPRPGEPFIFANRNVPTCTMLTDVMGVLGTLVAGDATRSIGVIGAGQIDRTGATNSTYSPTGSFIVGSGGANDLMTAAQEVVVTVSHLPGRLVAEVPYVTCPGDRVRSIVTTLGVFERAEGAEFVLSRTSPAAGQDQRAAVDRIRSCTGWDFDLARDLSSEPPPTRTELDQLRVFDPQSLFLGRHSSLSP